MLEHQKNILKALYREQALFLKEVYKSRQWLNEDEICELMQWIANNYPEIYKQKIEKIFDKIPT